VLPAVTGIEIGITKRIFVALQMHYNNPSQVPSLTDSSGINIYRTNTMRATQAGMFLMGTANVALPPQKSVYTLAGSCPSTQTAYIPAAGVTAYASFMHAHQRGRRIWTEVIRNGVRIGTIGNNQNYDFNLQKVQSLSPVMKMMPGDVYNTYCSYDTTADSTTITFGESTANEMCFNFIAYYPLLGTEPTYNCPTNMGVSSTPSATACSLLPGDPPAAYDVTGWTVVDTLFLTGGTATCKTGFTGTAAITCAGSGAPFTFSGCVRVTLPPSPAPTQPGSAVHLAVPFAVIFALALF